MLQGALIKCDKTILLQKNCFRNGLIMCIISQRNSSLNIIWIVDKQSFIIYQEGSAFFLLFSLLHCFQMLLKANTI